MRILARLAKTFGILLVVGVCGCTLMDRLGFGFRGLKFSHKIHSK